MKCARLFHAPSFLAATLIAFSVMGTSGTALAAAPKGEHSMNRIQTAEKNKQKFLGETRSPLAETDPELAAMRALDGREATEYFYRAWTVKESYVKLTGEGLGRRLSDIGTDGDGRILLCGEDTGVSAVNICLGDYAAACAFTGEPPAGIEREIL